MPGAIGASASAGRERRWLRQCARARARCRRAAARPAAAAGAPSRQATMVDSTPTAVGPPSRMRSMRPPRSAITCCAVVGETWPERLAEGATTGRPSAARRVARDRMAGHAHRDAVEAGGRELGDRAAGALRQHQRQRTRPEGGGQPFGGGVEPREPLRGGEIGDVGDQRIERRPALGGVEPRDRRAVGGVGAEPVDRLGRKGDEAARREASARRRRSRRARSGATVPDVILPSSFVSAGLCASPELRLPVLAAPGGVYKAAFSSRSVAQSGSAPRSGRGGRRFKSCHSDHFPAASKAVEPDPYRMNWAGVWRRTPARHSRPP